MSTSDRTSPNHISSILLAVRQTRRPSPEKVLHHLKDPEPSKEYHYLDALATLCSFASAQCESASAAVKNGAHDNHLYMATSPSAPSTMRDQLLAWIDLIQKLPVRTVQSPSPSHSDSESDSESDYESDYDSDESDIYGPDASEKRYTIPEQTFITDYHVCHAKFLDIISRDGAGQSMLDYVASLSERYVKHLGIADASLVDKLQFLIDSAEKRDSDPLSTEDLLELHCSAGVLTQFKDAFVTPSAFVLLDADRLSHAVDTILTFATSTKYKERINLPWTVVCIDVPRAAGNFVATTDRRELADMVDKELHHSFQASPDWVPFKLYGNVHAVEGTEHHVTANGIVHCESAFIHHISSNQISTDPYIGCSHPICYACLMLVRAYNQVFRTNIGAGPRNVNLRELDIAWSYPAMGPVVYKRLRNRLIGGLKQLCREHDYGRVRPIVIDPTDF